MIGRMGKLCGSSSFQPTIVNHRICPRLPAIKGTVIPELLINQALCRGRSYYILFFTPTGTNKYTFPVVSLAIQETILFNCTTGFM
jgi:hypothetical protein